MIDTLKPLIKQFLPFAQERMGFQHPPRLFLRQDSENAANPLGKTAYYDPEASSITLYITNRHPKDIMRSLSHELVHHAQNCNGELENAGEMGEGYAQNNPHMREIERFAYEKGNLCFRDWEDSLKGTIYNEHLQKGVEKNMSTKDWKNGELNSLLLEKWGFKFDLNKLNENAEEEVVEEEEELEEEKKPDADGDGVPDWADKDSDSDKKELEEMCPMDHGADEADAMVVGDEGPEEAGSPETRAVELVDELRDVLMQLTGDGEGEMEEEPMEERRGRGRAGSSTSNGRSTENNPNLSESDLRELVKEALKIVMERKK